MALFNSVSAPLSSPTAATGAAGSLITSATSFTVLASVTLTSVNISTSPIRPVFIGAGNDGNVGGGVLVVTTTSGVGTAANLVQCRDQDNRIIQTMQYGWFPGNTPTGSASMGVPNSLLQFVDPAPTAATMTYTVSVAAGNTGVTVQISNVFFWALQKGV